MDYADVNEALERLSIITESLSKSLEVLTDRVIEMNYRLGDLESIVSEHAGDMGGGAFGPGERGEDVVSAGLADLSRRVERLTKAIKKQGN